MLGHEEKMTCKTTTITTKQRKQTNKAKQSKANKNKAFSENAMTQPCCSLPVEDSVDAGFRPVVNVGEYFVVLDADVCTGK